MRAYTEPFFAFASSLLLRLTLAAFAALLIKNAVAAEPREAPPLGAYSDCLSIARGTLPQNSPSIAIQSAHEAAVYVMSGPDKSLLALDQDGTYSAPLPAPVRARLEQSDQEVAVDVLLPKKKVALNLVLSLKTVPNQPVPFLRIQDRTGPADAIERIVLQRTPQPEGLAPWEQELIFRLEGLPRWRRLLKSACAEVEGAVPSEEFNKLASYKGLVRQLRQDVPANCPGCKKPCAQLQAKNELLHNTSYAAKLETCRTLPIDRIASAAARAMSEVNP